MQAYIQLKKSKVALRFIIALILLFICVNFVVDFIKQQQLKRQFLTNGGEITLGMNSPTLKNFTNNKRDLTINAERALHLSESEIFFRKIGGNSLADNYGKLDFSANSGIYLQEAKLLKLIENVALTNQANFRLNTEQAEFATEQNNITGQNRIEFSDDLGDFTAQKFDFSLNDKIYNFTKDIEVKLNSSRANAQIIAQNLTAYEQKNYLEAWQKAKYTDFEVTMFAEFFKLDYIEQAGQLVTEKIAARDQVRIFHKDIKITGVKADFFPNLQEIIITENVVLTQGENIITGESLIYDMQNSSFRILKGDDNRVKLNFIEDVKSD